MLALSYGLDRKIKYLDLNLCSKVDGLRGEGSDETKLLTVEQRVKVIRYKDIIYLIPAHNVGGGERSGGVLACQR